MKYAHDSNSYDRHNPEGGSGSGRFHHDPAGDRHGHAHGFGGADFGGFGPGGFGPRGFGPRGFGPRGQRRANRGDVRAAILSLLEAGPSSGYGLIKAIAEKTGGSWRPSPGSVYPTLQQLLDEELIVATGDDRRTEYELSEAGRAYVDENATELAQAWESNPGPSEADAAFFGSVGKLMGVIHQFHLSATEAQRASAIDKIDELRRALYLILAD
jgi:Predicted transcriptional regulators